MQAEYQFLHFNRSGVIDSSERLRLAGDDAALERARGAMADARIEVWHGSRRVGVIPPARMFAARSAPGRRTAG